LNGVAPLALGRGAAEESGSRHGGEEEEGEGRFGMCYGYG